MPEKKSPNPLKLIGIGAVCLFILFIIVTGIAQLNISHAEALRSNNKLSVIQQEILDKDYRSALENLQELKVQPGYKNKKIYSETEKLTKEIEYKLYEDCKQEKYGKSLCEIYLEFYPRGKYIKEIKQELE